MITVRVTGTQAQCNMFSQEMEEKYFVSNISEFYRNKNGRTGRVYITIEERMKLHNDYCRPADY